MSNPCTDEVIRCQWHAIGAVDEIPAGVDQSTLLLGEEIGYRREPDGTLLAWIGGDGRDGGRPLPTNDGFGYLWTSLVDDPVEMFEIPETLEPDRRTLSAVSVGIETSPPRAVENFLDLGHFPFVHPSTLGQEPHTEVRDYQVDVRDGDIWATDCVFYQPQAAAHSAEGIMADYQYRVPHPYAALLYKTSPSTNGRWDVIGIFIHPMTDVRIRAHLFLSVIDETTTDADLRSFQQTIIGQDKIILENHIPRRMPLDPGAEVPIRADATSIAYRRWLTDLGVTYGVIPAAA